MGVALGSGDIALLLLRHVVTQRWGSGAVLLAAFQFHLHHLNFHRSAGQLFWLPASFGCWLLHPALVLFPIKLLHPVFFAGPLGYNPLGASGCLSFGVGFPVFSGERLSPFGVLDLLDFLARPDSLIVANDSAMGLRDNLAVFIDLKFFLLGQGFSDSVFGVELAGDHHSIFESGYEIALSH